MPENVEKQIKGQHQNYYVLDKIATGAKIKALKTDSGGTFYTYNLYTDNRELIALNRYVYKNTDEQPFEELTEDEEVILNPIPEETEEII